MSSSESILMNNNVEIPQLALGTYDITNEEIVNVIESGLSIGYRHIDCAWLYGNEKGIGKSLSNQFKKGEIKRSDLFLTSKLWCSFHKFERVRQQCLITINDLQCQYLDLFLIHWPFAFVDQDPEKNEECQSNVDDKLDFIVTWKAMELLVDEGLVKSIGLSNFNEEQIERIIQICKYKPVVNQVEIHPYCPQIQLEIFCKKHQILLEAYAPLGAKNRQWKKENDPEILEDKTIKSIADKYNVHPASVLLRYIIDRNLVCVVKSSNHERLKQNFHSINENQFKLDQEDFNKIHNDIQIIFRYHQLQERRHAKEYPFKHWKDFVP
ncbi:unnamed protein product [Rotaria magnacalcarata]|uniref:NADP-dependent oxidoreductase domain-containing protein n=3 Tax=Rotaria magnacalcarata TaxID=392030 RepID=A0A816ZR84_9BILA|nr:unnamed protein product [Rotaria magnacalcarata]CAF2228049.1 unnamed protein product [Rotaria magnacalcarata]CAF3959092.1 unnamed protein product [Rotaria magnacalcarata]CAF4467407.1 unnamed protein product [Rotaria magnacalcarata]